MLENVGLELIGFLSGNGNTGGAHVTEVLQEILDAGDAQVERIEAAEGGLAPVFSASTAYSTGDYVLHEGKLYRFTANHAAGAWKTTDVVAVTAGGELKNIREDVGDIEEDVSSIKTDLNKLGLSVVDGALCVTFTT